MSKRDYYEVLGVERQATDQQIKSAYRKLALKFHPDRNPGDHKAEERFKEAAEAYAVLADREKRGLYDRFGHAGVSWRRRRRASTRRSSRTSRTSSRGSATSSGSAISSARRRRRGGPQRGSDLRYDLEISFEESAIGTETTIQIPREETCETCKGIRRSRGHVRRNVQPVQGPGQLRYQQGFLTVARPCSNCRGTGKTIASRARRAAAPDASAASASSRSRFPAGIATGQRLRLYGEGEHGSRRRPRRATSTSSSTCRSTRSSIAKKTTSTARCRSASRRSRSAAA